MDLMTRSLLEIVQPAAPSLPWQAHIYQRSSHRQVHALVRSFITLSLSRVFISFVSRTFTSIRFHDILINAVRNPLTTMGNPKSKPRTQPENPYDACLTLSYARPTMASEARRAPSKLHISKTKAPQSHSAKESPPKSRPPLQGHGNRGLLSECIRPKPPTRKYAGFFDLPAELRNTIYELTCLFTGPRNLNFHCGAHYKRPRNATPALLRADIRLLIEAGSYYFSSNTFDIITGRGDIGPLSTWLRFIGRRNRVHLAQNANVTLRLVPKAHGCDGRPSFRTRFRTFLPPVQLYSRIALVRAGHGAAVKEVSRRLPVSDRWKWTADCRCEVPLPKADDTKLVGYDHDAHERAHREIAARRGLVWLGYSSSGGEGSDIHSADDSSTVEESEGVDRVV